MSIDNVVSNTKFNILGQEFQFRVERIEKAKNGVIIFMPSAKSPAAKELMPYYPRMKWSSSLSEFCVIYVADTFDGLDYAVNNNASWFISEEGQSSLPTISVLIKEILPHDHAGILIYGSSMGGFAALYLTKLIDAKCAVVECPQIDLNKYKGSKGVVKHCFGSFPFNNEWTNVFDFYNKNGFPSTNIFLSISIGDVAHLRYLHEELVNPNNRDLLSNLKENNFNIDIRPYTSGFGHVNMNMHEGVKCINDMVEKYF